MVVSRKQINLGVFYLMVGFFYHRLAVALPPFEIRSSLGKESEQAENWKHRLENMQTCKSSSDLEQQQPTFLCRSSKTNRHHPPECIYGSRLCDGIADCPGGEDEEPFACSLRSLMTLWTL